jgi:non-specific protein-tyrosine kinase
MKVERFIRLLARWSWLIALSALLAGEAANMVSQEIVPVYQASTSFLVHQALSNTAVVDYNTLHASEAMAQTYAQLLLKRPVLEGVVANLKLDTTADALAKNVNVKVVRDTQLIVVTVEDSDPQRAANIANEIVNLFIQQNRTLQSSRYDVAKESLQSELEKAQAEVQRIQVRLEALGTPSTSEQLNLQNQLQALLAQNQSNYATLFKSLSEVRLAEAQATDDLYVVESARPSSTPERPTTQLYILLAALIGGTLATGLVLLIGFRDNSVHSREQVEDVVQVPTLAAVGHIKGSKGHSKLIALHDPASPITESYRLIRTNIEFASSDTPIQTIVVTSCNPSEGKTVTVANLAIVMAQAGKRVILVDADLRRPMLHEFFQKANKVGISTALSQNNSGRLDANLIETGIENLRLLPSGPMVSNPAELLGSEHMIKLVEKLRQQADFVLFDSPPLLPVVDASLVSHVCDATLLVVMNGTTQTDDLPKAAHQLFQSGTRLLGVVLNRATDAHNRYSEYYHKTSERRLKQGVRAGQAVDHPEYIRGPNNGSQKSPEANMTLNKN